MIGAFVAALWRALRPGGVLFLSAPHQLGYPMTEACVPRRALQRGGTARSPERPAGSGGRKHARPVGRHATRRASYGQAPHRGGSEGGPRSRPGRPSAHESPASCLTSGRDSSTSLERTCMIRTSSVSRRGNRAAGGTAPGDPRGGESLRRLRARTSGSRRDSIPPGFCSGLDGEPRMGIGARVVLDVATGDGRRLARSTWKTISFATWPGSPTAGRVAVPARVIRRRSAIPDLPRGTSLLRVASNSTGWS